MSTLIPSQLEWDEFQHYIEKQSLKKEIMNILCKDLNTIGRLRVMLLQKKYIDLISNLVLEFNIDYDILENTEDIKKIIELTKKFPKSLIMDEELFNEIDDSVKGLFLKEKIESISLQKLQTFHTESALNGLVKINKISQINPELIKDPVKNPLYARYLLLQLLSSIKLDRRNIDPYTKSQHIIPSPLTYFGIIKSCENSELEKSA